ncbi:MAG: SIR2 family NAD-dependent protein deacylase [Candidatus Heimdallarchaeaceae archaeon]
MNIDEIIKELHKIQNLRIVSIVGAGISKASGMPTFRGEDGLWNKYRATDLATPIAFYNDPNLVWNWYRARMRILLEAEPNPAHKALVELEEKGIGLGIITQNVDGLHEIAGSKNIIEIHGRIRYARCTKCAYIERWDNWENAKADDSLPYCPKCKTSLLRPDVVWFGESLNPSKTTKAMEWLDECNIVLVIGTSGVVYPVASFPSYAKQRGAKVIEFNIEPTPISEISDYSIFGPCEETLPEFVDLLIKKY